MTRPLLDGSITASTVSEAPAVRRHTIQAAVMAALYGAGVRGGALTALQAWKEILLGVALSRVSVDALRARRLAFAEANGVVTIALVPPEDAARH